MGKIIEEIRIGYCCNCDAKILDLKQKDITKRRLENYAETFLKLNDGSLMKIAVCKKCEAEMNAEMAGSIMKRHHKSWQREIKESQVIPENKKPEALKRHNSLEAVDLKVDRLRFLKERAEVSIQKEESDIKEKSEQENFNKMECEKMELKINAKSL